MFDYIDCPQCGAREVSAIRVACWQKIRAQHPDDNNPVVCSYCGLWVEWQHGQKHKTEQRKQQQITYDEQVILTYRYSFTDDRAKNVQYKLIEKNSGKILAEGRTDDRGQTERVCTEKPEYVDIIIIRPNDEKQEVEKNIGMFKTNDDKNSYYLAHVGRGRIFFDIRYVNAESDKAQSFIKAAETQKRKASGRGFDKYNEGDVWWSFEVTTECDIKTAWQKIYDLQQKYDMEVHEGHLFTHATKDQVSLGGNSGLLFARDIGCTADGMLSFAEIVSMQELKWTKTSMLVLYGCRTGMPAKGESGATIAHAFFNKQKSVRQVIGQTGKSYFSYVTNEYREIIDSKDDTKDIYLWAFYRSENYLLGRAGHVMLPTEFRGIKMQAFTLSR